MPPCFIVENYSFLKKGKCKKPRIVKEILIKKKQSWKIKRFLYMKMYSKIIGLRVHCICVNV